VTGQLPSPVVPAWLADALQAPGERSTVDVDGRAISVRAWGEPGGHAVVLVHGGAAHAGWWQAIAPALAGRHRRVASLDLSGHGESSHAETYSFDRWADEVMAVAAAAGGPAGTTVVGHSMGGAVALNAAARFGHLLRGVVVVDSGIREYTEEELAPFTRRADAPPPVFATRQDALRRFRLLPDAPDAIPLLLAHIAAASIRPYRGGWSWRYDRRTFRHSTMSPTTLRPARCPVVLVRGERGAMPDAVCTQIRQRVGQECPVHEVSGAGHHVMVERPGELLPLLRSILDGLEDVAKDGR